MKKLILISFLIFQGVPLWAARAGDAGVGVVLGDPLGPTFKYWFNNTRAIDVGLGFNRDFSIYADYLWHGWNVFPQPTQGKLGGYVGLGPRFENENPYNEFGIRTLVGTDYWLQQYPIEFFLEFGPVFVLSPKLDTHFDGGIGLRVYFAHH